MIFILSVCMHDEHMANISGHIHTHVSMYSDFVVRVIYVGLASVHPNYVYECDNPYLHWVQACAVETARLNWVCMVEKCVR